MIAAQVPEGSLGLIIALPLPAFSIVGALYQSYLIQERIRINPAVRDTAVMTARRVLCLLGVMCLIVIVCAAAILKPKGIPGEIGLGHGKGARTLVSGAMRLLFS